MNKTKYKVLREKKLTNSYCLAFPMMLIIAVLRNDNTSELWNKLKKNWTVEDWKEFFKIKIDHYEIK